MEELINELMELRELMFHPALKVWFLVRAKIAWWKDAPDSFQLSEKKEKHDKWWRITTNI